MINSTCLSGFYIHLTADRQFQMQSILYIWLLRCFLFIDSIIEAERDVSCLWAIYKGCPWCLLLCAKFPVTIIWRAFQHQIKVPECYSSFSHLFPIVFLWRCWLSFCYFLDEKRAKNQYLRQVIRTTCDGRAL